MTEFSNLVEYKRKQLAAEEWATEVRSIHKHKLSSMWYDTRPQDTKHFSVIDTQYNDNSIERRLHNGALIFFNEEKLTGEALIDAWEKDSYGRCVCGTKFCSDEYTHTLHGF